MRLLHRCGTRRLANTRLKIDMTPSPRISPLASTMMGVSSFCAYRHQYQFRRPPIVRASVKDGRLYMPVMADQQE